MRGLTIGLGILVLTGTAQAQGFDLSRWDRNDDLLLSREEFRTGTGGSDAFKKLDYNNDGWLDASEWSTRSFERCCSALANKIS